MFSPALDSSPPWDFRLSSTSFTDDWLADIDLSDLPPISSSSPDAADLPEFLDLDSVGISDLLLPNASPRCLRVSDDSTFETLLLSSNPSAASPSTGSSDAPIAVGMPPASRTRQSHASNRSGHSSTSQKHEFAWINHEVQGADNLRAVSSCMRQQEEAPSSDLDGTGIGDSDGKSEKLDPCSKRQQRLVRNRELAFESRQRKKCYIRDLEAKCKTLEQERDYFQQQVCFSFAENTVLKEELARMKKMKGKYGVAEPAVLFKDSLPLEFLSLLFCLLLLLAPCSLFGNPFHALEPRTASDLASSKAKGSVLSKEQALRRKCFSNFKAERQLWFHPPCQLMIAWQEPLKQTFCK